MFNDILIVFSYLSLFVMITIILVRVIKALTFKVLDKLYDNEKPLKLAYDATVEIPVMEEPTFSVLDKNLTPSQKRRKTVMQRYGVTNVAMLDFVKLKRKQTVEAKYGVPYTFLLSPKKLAQRKTIEGILLLRNSIDANVPRLTRPLKRGEK